MLRPSNRCFLIQIKFVPSKAGSRGSDDRLNFSPPMSEVGGQPAPKADQIQADRATQCSQLRRIGIACLSIDIKGIGRLWADRADGHAHHARTHRIQSLSATDPPQAPANAQARSRPCTACVKRRCQCVNVSTLLLIGCGWRPHARFPPRCLWAAGRSRGAAVRQAELWLLMVGQGASLKAQHDAVAPPLPRRLAMLVEQLEAQG